MIRYLKLRSTLFPPPPEYFENDKYFVLGWNTIKYNDFKCTGCEEIRSEIMNRYNLKAVDITSE
jgi:hypothetical protein